MPLPFREQILSLLFSCGGGALSGAFSTLFLLLLNLSTDFRIANPWLIGLLPLAGLAIGLSYTRFSPGSAPGITLVFHEVERPAGPLPGLLAPFILLFTLVTHLFGGSAGRESTAVQMGASAADLLSRPFRMEPEARRRILVAGMSAGFSSALGTPLAGALFGMEILRKSGFRFYAWRECLVASFTAFYVSRFLGAPHTQFPAPALFDPVSLSLLWAACAGAAFGCSAWIFSLLRIRLLKVYAYLPWPALRPALGGLVVALLFLALGTDRYAGLGIAQIKEALTGESRLLDPLWKGVATALTVSSGLKGGEFIPLVFLGSTLGNILSGILPMAPSQLAALGFGAVFGAASKTPFACALMLGELFGWEILPAALACCYVAFGLSGSTGIYHGQKPGKERIWKWRRITRRIR